MEWARLLNQKVAMFLLDFEKAYDKIEWKFIFMMLEAFDFHDLFCHCVLVLLVDAHAQIEVNGVTSQPFKLGRSIRQGCHLAPALFVIAYDVLFYLLRENSLSPKVKDSGAKISQAKSTLLS
ncbi:secreted RxLR effector protein 78-like [Cryptomeria japonica]|uniref:secreted RxLR effector protein 78-like n=1 Tax=Cryptomeria japonica TaxID=3369 RepID=UPI0027DA0DF9|nr:secreted RxLR effector protein 78-like [Cryptomeria japonica]